MNGPGSALEILDHWVGGRLPPTVLVFAWILFWVGFGLAPAAIVLSWAERKIGADFQARVGPNRVGPAGIGQGFADALKLLSKRAALPSRSPGDASRTSSAFSAKICLLVMMFVPVVCAAIIPPTHAWVFADSDIAALLPLFLTAVTGLATLLYAFERNRLTSASDGVRQIAQWVSYFFCALICLAAAGLQAGALSWTALVDSQGFSPWRWGAVASPMAPVLAGIFFIAGLGLLGLSPLNTAGSERDLRGGVTEGSSGVDALLLLWARRFALMAWSNLFVIIYVGAWRLPSMLVEILNENDLHGLRAALEVIYLLAKALIILILTHWVTRVIPRLRPDQSTDFSWKVLSPLALLSLILTGLWIGVTHG